MKKEGVLTYKIDRKDEYRWLKNGIVTVCLSNRTKPVDIKF